MIYYNRTFMNLTISLAIIYFISTNIQFWITDYLYVVIKADIDQIYFMFMVICITAPTLGAIVSGFIGTCLGGSTSKYAMPAVLIMATFAACFGIPIPFFNNVYIVTGLIWLYYFTGGCMIPIMTLVMISSVEPELKSKANAFANLTYYSIGYFPAPFIYGYICDYTGGKTSRWGFIFSFFLNIIPMILITTATFYHPDT